MRNRDDKTAAAIIQARAMLDLLCASAVDDEGFAITPALLRDCLWAISDTLALAQAARVTTGA